MKEKEIIDKWKKGLSKEQLALIYKREYNQNIKIIRSQLRHRHDGRFITNYEALKTIENVLLRYIKKKYHE